jgi:Flp pilus assembly protein TadG
MHRARKLAKVCGDSSGSVAIMFSFIFILIVLATGVAIDFARAVQAKSKLQDNVDAALLAAVNQIGALSEDSLKSQVIAWLQSQHKAADVTYSMSSGDITIDKASNTITAAASATLPTTIISIFNIPAMNVSVLSTVAASSMPYVNIYIVLDKSASMLLAATASGQEQMLNSQAHCVFACHTPEGGPWKYNGSSYNTNYDLAKAMGVTLRADVSVSATMEVLSLISQIDQTGSHIKVGLYTMGSALTEALAPTYGVSAARSAVTNDATGLTSATSEPTSRFDVTIPALSNLVGGAGDGKSAAAPLKLVLMLTDGVISERDWVMNGVWWDADSKMHGGTDWYKVAPFNPDWCSSMKKNNVTVGVLYTEYLPMAWDEGYLHTVGETMSSAHWKPTWGGVMKNSAPGSISRRDYISYALNDCASSDSMFLSASSSADIQAGLSKLFGAYIGKTRLVR